MGVQNLIGLGDQIAVMPAHIHRPWRATAEVATGRSQAPEPHAPVNVNWIDLEMNCTRELMYAVQDVVAAMGDNAPTPPRGTSGVCLARRLAYIAAAVAAYADDSTREDLRIVRDRLEHHHGYTTEDDKRQVSLAATRRAAGLPADHTDTASNIARLAAACGYSITASTVWRWGRDGYISVIERRPVHYYLSEMLEMLSERDEDTELTA